MIITFSLEFFGKTFAAKSGGPAALVCGVVDRVSLRDYRLTWKHDSPVGNLYAAITWANGRRVRFTIETRDAWKHGSRTSTSGRHMRKASWEAHRDVLTALFVHDPNATIKTALATYRGRADFKTKFPATGMQNIGSRVAPRTMPDCSL